MPITRRLRSVRLVLEPLRARDAAEMTDVLADAGLYTYIGGGPPTRDELKARYARWLSGSPRTDEAWHNWVIRLRDGGTAIGHLQATVSAARKADIAWLIGTQWQRRGYASEAARALVEWLAGAGAVTITAHIAAGHLGSARVAAAAGLAQTDEVEDGEVVWRWSRSPAR